MSLGQAQIDSYNSQLSTLASAQASGSFGGLLYSLVPQPESFVGNGANDYWNKVEVLRGIIDPSHDAIPHDEQGRVYYEVLRTQYMAGQGIDTGTTWASPGTINDPLHLVPQSQGDYNSLLHDQRLAIANANHDLGGALSGNTDYAVDQIALGVAQGSLLTIGEGLFIGTVGNAVTLVQNAAVDIASGIVHAAESIWGAITGQSFTASITSLSGYDSGNSNWGYVDDYLSSFDGGGGGGDYNDYFRSEFYYPDPHIGGARVMGARGGSQSIDSATADYAMM